MLTNCCPGDTTLPDTIVEGCAQNFGQIQKVIFQRLYNGDTRNSIAGGTEVGNAGLLASWTALKAATDGTKIMVSPYIESPADDGGDAKTYGGGNDTLNGIEVIIGSNPVNFTARLNSKQQNIIAELKKLMCEAQNNNLGVYLVNERGQIEGIKEVGASDEVSWSPIPIRKLYVGDKLHGNLDAPDYNPISWSYVPGYSDKLDVITLNASALSL